MTVGSSIFDRELQFQPSIMLLAQQGDCRAIAQWLNPYLSTQGIQAQVTMDRPRCLRVLVQFEHVPNQQRLTRFICHRLCKLNSQTFNTVRIQAQYLGTRLVLWEQTVRLALPAPISPTSVRAIAPNTSMSALVHVPSPLPPRLTLKRLTTPPWLEASQLILFKNPLLLAAAMLAFLVGANLDMRADHTAPSVAKGGNRSIALPSLPRPDRITTSVGTVTVQPMTDPTDRENAAEQPVTLAFSNDAVVNADVAEDLEQVIDRADVAFVHLDQPVPTEQLQTQSIDLVDPATESLSQDRAAFSRSLRSLDQAHIPTVGSGRDRRDARRPEIVEVRGQRIAYLGYSDSEMTASFWSTGVNPAEEAHIAEDIQAIRDQVDWVVVTYRWSQDLADYPADWQVRLAHWAVDHGADLVVGYHPDVLQGAEIYKGRAIAYSLGDFVYPDSQASGQDYKTATLQVSIRDRQMKLDFVPIQVRQGKPDVARGRAGRAILRYIEQASGLFEQPIQFPTVLDNRDLDDRDRPATPTDTRDQSLPAAPDSFISYPDASPAMPQGESFTRDQDTPADKPADGSTMRPTERSPRSSRSDRSSSDQLTLPDDADPRAFIDDPSPQGER